MAGGPRPCAGSSAGEPEHPKMAAQRRTRSTGGERRRLPPLRDQEDCSLERLHKRFAANGLWRFAQSDQTRTVEKSCKILPSSSIYSEKRRISA